MFEIAAGIVIGGVVLLVVFFVGGAAISEWLDNQWFSGPKRKA